MRNSSIMVASCLNMGHLTTRLVSVADRRNSICLQIYKESWTYLQKLQTTGEFIFVKKVQCFNKMDVLHDSKVQECGNLCSSIKNKSINHHNSYCAAIHNISVHILRLWYHKQIIQWTPKKQITLIRTKYKLKSHKLSKKTKISSAVQLILVLSIVQDFVRSFSAFPIINGLSHRKLC